MNKKLLHKSIMESVSKSLGKTLNEGAGAGYDVTFEGLNVNTIKVGKYDLKGNDRIVRFTATLGKSIVEWKAIGYYDGVTSDGVYYDDHLVEEFDDLQKTVEGGQLSGYVYLDDVENGKPSWDSSEVDKDDVYNFIKKWLTDFSFTTMYGGGWVHVNLQNPMIFEDIEIEDNYSSTYVFIDTIEIDAPEITETINWYFANYPDFDQIYGDDLDESLKYKKDKHINESFTMVRELQSILRKFRIFIDMDRFGEIAYNDEDEELDPSLQRIISQYDQYVEDVIGKLQYPDASITYNHIVQMAEDNERRTGTEADMVVDFLEKLYIWCLKHGLEKATLRESAKIKTKKKSVTEDLSKADKEDAESKMDKWHEGKRKQNVKACSTDKLIMNLGICKRKGYDSEAQQIQDELDSRGINESQLFEGEVAEHNYGPEFDEVIEHVKNGTVNADNDSEILFDALVPGTGHAESLGGELLRAAERIAYRYYNDGDMAGEGYGRETVNPAVRYMKFAVRPSVSPLYGIVNDFYRFIDYGCNVNDQKYEIMVMDLLKYTVIHIVENKLWDVPNHDDMLDFRDSDVDVDRRYDWEDDDY